MNQVVFPVISLDMGQVSLGTLVTSRRGKPAVVFMAKNYRLESLPVSLPDSMLEQWALSSQLLLRGVTLEGSKGARILVGQNAPDSAPGALILAKVESSRKILPENHAPESDVIINQMYRSSICIFAGVVPAGVVMRYQNDRERYFFFDGHTLVCASQFSRDLSFNERAKDARAGRRTAQAR